MQAWGDYLYALKNGADVKAFKFVTEADLQPFEL
jgi:hypothetical protein